MECDPRWEMALPEVVGYSADVRATISLTESHRASLSAAEGLKKVPVQK